MKVREIMTPDAVSCQSDADIVTAARLMLEGRFGALPVLDAHGRVIGMITDRDIAMAATARRRAAAHIAVHEAMSQTVHSCFADDDVAAALKRMEEARVRRLPVLDATWHLSGILSLDDVVLRALDRTDGISSGDFIRAFRRICEQPPIEPDVNFSDPSVSG